MIYFIGDIHGHLERLVSLVREINSELQENDTIVFLGDYIDRGIDSYEVIEFLIELSRYRKAVFLKGNHEDMMLKYLKGDDPNGIFLYNGGDMTIRSYKKNVGAFKLPFHHRDFFSGLRLVHEGEDFIAVHAGLNPAKKSLADQDERDLLWIRDKFFRSSKRWEKTVIFGHTPTSYMGHGDQVYIDKERNIIGIDSGVIFGRKMSCLRWPDRKIFYSQ